MNFYERLRGRILNINYFLPDSINLPFQFAILFNMFRNKVMPYGNTRSGYAEVATQSDTAFPRHFPAKINRHVSCKIPFFPFPQDHLTCTGKFVAYRWHQIFGCQPWFKPF
jgi:hypothetical protein